MPATPSALEPRAVPADPAAPDPLTARVVALGELLGLSGTRIAADELAESRELLARVGERRRLSLDHTVVALAGATGSGKSTLFNALAGLELSATGVRRPTTSRPVSCAWEPERAAALLDRLGVAPQDRYARYGVRDMTALPPRPGRAGADGGDALCSVGDIRETGTDLDGAKERSLEGLVLIDLPDHDSAAAGHREQVDRLLRLVDVVVWVLDPEKYADAALHERYLRPLAGHADVTVLVLNQVDRLPGDTADLVLDDLRRLLDDDGLAMCEHGEAGAVVLAASALTGQGMPDLRAVLAQIVAERAAAGRRLAADLDRAARELRPLYVGAGPVGLTEPAREEFTDRLADAVGATGAGLSAERDWERAAWDACRSPWSRLISERDGAGAGSRFGRKSTGSLVRRTRGRRTSGLGAEAGFRPFVEAAPAETAPAGAAWSGATGPAVRKAPSSSSAPSSPSAPSVRPTRPFSSPRTTSSRPAVDEAVRCLAVDAARGLPEPWARAVRGAAGRGGLDLPAALDAAVDRSRPGEPEWAGWWSLVAAGQWLMMTLALTGAVCLTAVATGWTALAWWPLLAVIAAGGLGGPLLAGAGRIAARGPARRYGQAAERRLRDAAADCGRIGVLEPVAAEIVRYREVREQYAVVAGNVPASAPHRPSVPAGRHADHSCG